MVDERCRNFSIRQCRCRQCQCNKDCTQTVWRGNNVVRAFFRSVFTATKLTSHYVRIHRLLNFFFSLLFTLANKMPVIFSYLEVEDHPFRHTTKIVDLKILNKLIDEKHKSHLRIYLFSPFFPLCIYTSFNSPARFFISCRFRKWGRLRGWPVGAGRGFTPSTPFSPPN